jgi:hypothetical protein
MQGPFRDPQLSIQEKSSGRAADDEDFGVRSAVVLVAEGAIDDHGRIGNNKPV